MDEYLEKNFANVNMWLHFAEAKNAANIALAMAAVVGLLGQDEKNVLIYFICIIFCCSGGASLVSFWPNLGDVAHGGNKTSTPNLQFFEHIKNYSGKEYVEEVNKVYFRNSSQKVTQYQEDLAKEIVYNAKIASRKYKLFKIAFYGDLIAFLSIILFLICA